MAPPLRRRFFEEMRVQVHFMYYVVCSLYGCSVLIFNHFPSTSSLPLALSVPHAHNITLGAHTPIFRVPLYATTRESGARWPLLSHFVLLLVKISHSEHKRPVVIISAALLANGV